MPPADGAWSGTPLAFPLIQGADCCGRIVQVGVGVAPVLDARVGARRSVRGVRRRTRPRGVSRRVGLVGRRTGLAPVRVLDVERGEIEPVVARTYPLREIVQAQNDFMAKSFIGKLVLVVAAS